METCEKTIHLTNSWGKAGKRLCGKKAFWKFHNGKRFCEHHFNKWMKKQGGEIDKEEGEER